MFIAILFTIAKIRKQPKCPSIDEQIKWCVCVCVCVCARARIIENYSAIIKDEILPFVTAWMDLEVTMLSEIKQRQIPHDLTYVCNLKSKQINKQMKSRLRPIDRENNLLLARREGSWNEQNE